MKVLCIANDNDLPESELLCRLAESGVSIKIIIDPSSVFIEKYKASGIEVLPAKLSGKIDLKAQGLIRSTAVQFQPNLVHCFSKYALTNSVIALRGMKTPILAYRGIVGNLSVFDPGSWLSFLNPKVKKIVCVCEAVEDYLKEFSNLKEKALTIHKGHNVGWYDLEDPPRLSEFGVPENAFTISCLCNMRPRKGISVLIEALALLPSSAHLLLVGQLSGDSIPKQVESLGLSERVHCIGFQPRGWRYVGQSSVFVMPSLRREGLPKAVIEAMSQGVPAIVTDVGGMPEIVEDGTSGRVLTPGDPKLLAEALRAYMENDSLLNQHSKQARERIEAAFSIENTVDAYKKLYSEMGTH